MVSQVNVTTLKEKIDNGEDFLLLDVRRADELAIAKLDSATHIEMNQVPSVLDDLDPDKETIVMCRSGMRSMQVAVFLHNQGFSNVHNLEGGILAWASQIDPSMQTY
jgi:rhodanese-related sulfurtransferase